MKFFQFLLLTLIYSSLILSQHTCFSKKSKKSKKSKLNLPKKYKTLEDRSLYCSVCNTLLIEAEKSLSEDKDAKYEYQNYGHRIDSNGRPIKRNLQDENSIYSTATIFPHVEEISKLCDKWVKQTGTEHRDDGTVHMVQTHNITGTRGRLNIGDGSGNKISSMCHDVISKFEDNMIEVIKENNLQKLTMFCDKMVDPQGTQKKVCQPAEFPHYIIRHIESINEFKERSDTAENKDEL